MPTITPTPPSHHRVKTSPGTRHVHPPAHHAVRKHGRRATPHPTSTPLPTPTATRPAGTVTLVRYWVSSTDVRRGNTIGVGYVIDNETGAVAHVMLGASLKSERVLGWLNGSVADPGHDVVATVMPGISTHTRYFTLPHSLQPGGYDVAWGLRDAETGARDALVFASAALRVR